MPGVNDKAAPKKRKDQAPVPPVSGTTRRIVLTGAVIALVCAEAWSAPTLFALAEMAKSPRTLAWLLPAVLDTYAATSIWFGNNVPKSHPAHGAAIRNTRRALLLTVSANAVFHLLTLAGKQLPSWVPIALLITVMALPIYIADRLVHLYVLASGNGSGPLDERQPGNEKAKKAASEQPASTAASSGSQTPAPAVAPPVPAAESGSGVPKPTPAVIPINGNGRRSADDWALLALPLWHEYVDGHNGTTPTAAVLADLLRTAHPDLLVPGSDRSERNIRSATETLADVSDSDSESDREVAAR